MSLPTPVESITPAAREAAIASLQQLLGDRLSTAAAVRERHGKDASYHSCLPPDAVAFPRSTQEVSEIVQVCGRHKVPLIPFGGGIQAGARPRQPDEPGQNPAGVVPAPAPQSPNSLNRWTISRCMAFCQMLESQSSAAVPSDYFTESSWQQAGWISVSCSDPTFKRLANRGFDSSARKGTCTMRGGVFTDRLQKSAKSTWS